MYQLLNRMEANTTGINACKAVEQNNTNINEVYMDDMIETAIGIEPAAMYQLLKKMDAMIESAERDHAYPAYVDEVA